MGKPMANVMMGIMITLTVIMAEGPADDEASVRYASSKRNFLTTLLLARHADVISGREFGRSQMNLIITCGYCQER